MIRRVVALFGCAAAAIAVMACIMPLLHGHSNDGDYVHDADTGMTNVPVFLQTDERWSSLPYSDGTVATHGCGLTCAAMAASYYFRAELTPADLLDCVGNSCVDESTGVNDMTRFCEWMESRDPMLSHTVPYDDCKRALDDARYGRLVFCSVSGQLAPYGKDYGGHIVLLCAVNNQGVIIHDPCDAALSYGVMSMDDFTHANWAYFISVGRE